MFKATAPYLITILSVLFGYPCAVALHSPELISASVVRDATVLESTPDFTDLYLIQIQYKGKPVQIYCNSTTCYKQRSESLLA